MKPSRIGEFGLIQKIKAICDRPSDRVVLGIGDDGALVQPRTGTLAILTTDALVEGVHFDLRYTPLESLGWKALAVSLSDVAAMGGVPVCGVVSLAVPDNWSVENVEALYTGMERCGRAFACPVVGGDTVRSPGASFISITVLGEVEADSGKRRSTSRSGDLLCVTGELGGARTGWEALEGNYTPEQWVRSKTRFLQPRPRIGEARRLMDAFGVTACIDISDGLGSEIRHLCDGSGLGCEVYEDRIHVLEEAAAWALRTGNQPVLFAIESGEEYELLFTVDPDRWEQSECREELCASIPVTVIGAMLPAEQGMSLCTGDGRRLWTWTGWDHFLGHGSIMRDGGHD